jgi:heme-degrading monooxygenase HmoA
VVVRMWRTQIDPLRAHEYERFALEQSLPMFRGQRGFVGVLFERRGSHCAVVTLWADMSAADGLEQSPTYRPTVERRLARGRPTGDSEVERFEVIRE